MNSTIFISVGIVVIIILLILFIIRSKSKKRNREILLPLLDRVAEGNSEFKNVLEDQVYINRRRVNKWKEKYSSVRNGISFRYGNIGFEPLVVNQLNSFIHNFEYCEPIVDNRNNEFVRNQLKIHSDFFDSIESYPLDDQQRQAISHNEDNNLIIAGAGTGKTSTIVGKMAYLTEKLNVLPEEILLLSFTSKAANEMRERLQAKINKNLEVYTFHSFGLKMVSQVKGTRPELVFEDGHGLRSFIDDAVQQCLNNAETQHLLTDFMALYSQPAKFNFKSVGEYNDYIKEKNLITLNGESVKSHQELKIANYLFINRINYAYENKYEINTSDVLHRQYKPDFYLTDYGIYIEHFGIDENGNAPSWFSNPVKYVEEMQWKQKLHKTNCTKLIQTYSYEDHDGVLLENLKNKLELFSINLQPMPAADILKKINNYDKEYSLLVELLITFLNLFKSNLYTFYEMEIKIPYSEDPSRNKQFLKLFKFVYDKYETNLKQSGGIDFNDMISKATECIKENLFVAPYKYILIDEFQDISVGRYKLIKALREQNPDTKLFCVGDDWQSIYRFTGSDVNLIVDFEEYFGFTKKLLIETNYRFSQGIIDLSSKFIMKNPNQLTKSLVSSKKTKDSPFETYYKQNRDDYTALLAILRQINKEGGKKVYILGRYKWDEPKHKVDSKYLDSLRKQFNKTKIDFLTVHKSKGLEADYVILNNVISGRYGFPSGVLDDPILNLVLLKVDDYPNSEERRLFYVAMTRAKNKFFIISQRRNFSDFILELYSYTQKDPNSKICPNCGGQLILRLNSNTKASFYGCENFDSCRYTRDKLVKKMDNLLGTRKIITAKDDDLPF